MGSVLGKAHSARGRIGLKFVEAGANQQSVLIPYIVAGDPDLDAVEAERAIHPRAVQDVADRDLPQLCEAAVLDELRSHRTEAAEGIRFRNGSHAQLATSGSPNAGHLQTVQVTQGSRSNPRAIPSKPGLAGLDRRSWPAAARHPYSSAAGRAGANSARAGPRELSHYRTDYRCRQLETLSDGGSRFPVCQRAAATAPLAGRSHGTARAKIARTADVASRHESL